jgi:hypothetical protein
MLQLFLSLNTVNISLMDVSKPIATLVTQDAQPKIVDAPLTLIFRMGQ